MSYREHDGDSDLDSEQDELYDQAVQIVLKQKSICIGNTTTLKIGYNRAARWWNQWRRQV